MHFDGELVIKNYKRIDDHRPDTDQDTESLHEDLVEPEFEKAINATFAELGTKSTKYWTMALESKSGHSFKTRSVIYEGAVTHLPFSFKLWNAYTIEAIAESKKFNPLSKFHSTVNSLFDRALLYLHKMPRIWLNYASFLASQKKLTFTRNIYNSALRSLPMSQHEKIWEEYSIWAMSIECHSSAKSVLTRYLKFNPEFKETYVEYCVREEDYNEASIILDDERYYSKTGKSEYEFFTELASLVSAHPSEISSVDGEEIIKFGMGKYTDEVGNLWNLLANHYLKLGLFQKARDTFEEALSKVETAKDFEIIFKAYVDYHEEYINQLSLEEEDDITEVKELESLGRRIEKILELHEPVIVESELKDTDADLEILMEKLDELLERRPLLLNDCLLRHNPNNIKEWLNRFEIVKDNEALLKKTYGEAINYIQPGKAENGLFSDIWIHYADYFISKNLFAEANQVFLKASSIPFRTLEEHVNLWRTWAETLIEHKFYEDSLAVIKFALFGKSPNGRGLHEEQIKTSNILWSMYIDLERNLGTFETIKAAYKKMMDLHLITPYVLINYTGFLQENNFFEESFRVYESGVGMFPWPPVQEIWISYLYSFVTRYGGDKVERTRDLYERVLKAVPSNLSKVFYLMYGNFEERYGLINHCLEIYERMCSGVMKEERLEAYELYVAKVEGFLGITKTRSVFQAALENLTDEEVISFGIKFAKIETKVGEIDRGRAIYKHLSQFADPREDHQKFWSSWETFEISFGNVDTFKDLMRVKRSVLAKFSVAPPDVQKYKDLLQKSSSSTRPTLNENTE